MKKHRVRKWLAAMLSGVLALSSWTPLAVSAKEPDFVPVKTTLSVTGQPLHLQGFAVDKESDRMYWSFTETLVKTDLEGSKLGQVGLSDGHLGDVACYNGKIYGTMLGAPLPGHAWNDWTGFYLMVFDTDLNLLEKVDLPEFQRWYDSVGDPTANPYGINGLDGVTVGLDPNGEPKLMIAAGIQDDEKNTHQVIVQYSLDGNYTYEACYVMEIGSSPFGVQNLTYDWDTGHYWMSTYGAEKSYHAQECLFEVDRDLTTVLSRWNYSTAYGLESMGGGLFWTSGDSGPNGNKTGSAFLCQYNAKSGMSPYTGQLEERRINAELYYSMDKNTVIHKIPVTGNCIKDVGMLGLDAAVSNVLLSDGPDGAEGGSLAFTAESSAAVTVEQANILSNALTDELTLSCWVRLDEKAQFQGDPFVFIAGLTDENGRYIAAFEASWSCFVFHVAGSDNTNEAWAESAAIEAGKWYHLTGVYDGSTGKMALYVDDTPTADYGTATAPIRDVAHLNVGKEPVAGAEASDGYPHKTTDFIGSVSDLRVYSKALSDSEVKALTAGNEDAVETKPVVRYPMNREALQNSGGAGETGEGTTILKDSSGNGYSLETENVSYEDGRLQFTKGSAASLTGESLEAVRNALVSADAMTMTLDVIPTSDTISHTGFIGGLLTEDNKALFTYATGWSDLIGVGQAKYFDVYPADADNDHYVPGTGYQLTMVYNGEEITYYIDGVKQRTYEISLAETLEQLGSIQLGGSADQYTAYTGGLGSFRLYNRALSAEDAAALASGESISAAPLIFCDASANPLETVSGGDSEPAQETTAVMDQSGNGYHADADNSIAMTADKDGEEGKAVAFDGAGKIALTGGSMAGLTSAIRQADAAAISLWVRADESNGSFAYIAGLQNRNGDFALTLDSSWGNLVLRTVRPGGTYSETIYPASGAYQPGQWYHVVVTMDEAQAVLYIDGKVQGTVTTDAGILDDVASFSIGGTVKPAPLDPKHENFRGAVDDVHVFARELNDEMVQKLYAKPQKTYIELDKPKTPVTEYRLWTADWRQQILRSDTASEDAPQTIALEAARNESEPAQIVLQADGDFTIEEVVLSDLKNGDAVLPSSLAEAHYVGYVKLLNNNPNLLNPIQRAPGWFPEKLLNDASIEVEPDSAQPIWVRYTVPKDAAAGTYTGSVTVKTTMGEFEVPVSLTVRDVTLPDPQDGAFNLELWGQLVKCFEDTGNNLDVIGKAYDITAYSDEWWSLMETYAEFMRVNRLNSLFVNVADLLADAPGTSVAADGTITYDWSLLDRFVELFLEKGGIKQISAEHLCAQSAVDGVRGYKVEIIGGQGSNTYDAYLEFDQGGEEYLKTYLTELNRHLTEKGWSDIWHQHIGDEPTYGNMPTHYKKAAKLVHELCPGVTTGDALYGDNMPDFEDAMDVWVPMTSTFEDYKDQYEAELAAGKKIWLYTAQDPSKAFMNRFIDTQLYKSELLGWLCYKYGATGYLHWGLMEWYVWEDFDANDATVGDQNVKRPGDSWCIYPDKENMDITSSIRLEAIREAAEDYELFAIYQQKDAAGAENLVNSTVRSAINYDDSVAEVAAKRHALLDGAEGKLLAPGLWIAKTGNAITVDGALNEEEWSDSAVQHYPLNRVTGSPAVSGDAAFLWDNENLYLSAVLEGEGNRLDLFLDGNCRRGIYDEYTARYSFDLPDGTVTVSGNHAAVPDGVQIRTGKSGGSTVVEIALPWASLNRFAPKDGQKIGLTVHVSDANGSAGITTARAEDVETSENWGTAVLDGAPISKERPKPISRASGIVLDGVPDEAAWNIDKVLGEHFYGNCNNEAAFGLLWDETGLYAAFDVVDDVVVNSGAEYCWDDDSVELFLDLDCKGGAYGNTSETTAQFTFRYDDETTYLCGLPYDPAVNKIDGSLIRHKSARSEKGYTVEIFIPWAAFGRGDIAAGKVIAVTAQLNDKDVDDPTAPEESALAYTTSDTSNGSSAKGWPQFVLTGDSAAPTVEKVVVTAPASSMGPGGTLQLKAEVVGENVRQDVTWQVEGASSGDTAISEDGLLTAGADESGSLTVIAVSKDDPSVRGTFSVTVSAGGSGSGTGSGSSYRGWRKNPEGKWFFYDRNGRMVKGWRHDTDGCWYFLDRTTGKMAVGWLQEGGESYYLRSWGGMLTGWFQADGQWYFADKSGAVRSLTNAFGAAVYSYASADGSGIWRKDAVGQWVFEENGSDAVGWRCIDGVWYFFGTDHVMTTGWQFVNGVWYYLNPNGKMVTGWKLVSGKWYYLRSWGGMLSDGITPDGYRVDASGVWVG